MQIAVTDDQTIDTTSGDLILDSASNTVNINADTNIVGVTSITGDTNIIGDLDLTNSPSNEGRISANYLDVPNITPIGSIIAWPGGINTWPTQNWRLCNGAALNRTTYADLFGIISTTYGNGDGSTTFNLPNLQSRFIGGVGNSPLNTLGNTGGNNNQAVFDFDAFPLYAFFKMRDGAFIRAAELHDIDELNNLSTQNPQWKRNFDQNINTTTGQFDAVDRTTYGLPSPLETGQLDVSGVGDSSQISNIPNDDVVPAAFQQVSRLSSSTIDTQGESILRPGARMTTLYINNETKYFDLEDVFGFDRKVLTPDVVNTEAMFIVGRAIGNTAVDIEVNVTYVEQL